MAGNALEVAKELYAAYARGDVESFQGMLDDELEWHEADGILWGGTYHGKQETNEKALAPIGENIDDFTVTPQAFFEGEGGDSVATRVRYRARASRRARRSTSKRSTSSRSATASSCATRTSW